MNDISMLNGINLAITEMRVLATRTRRYEFLLVKIDC